MKITKLKKIILLITLFLFIGVNAFSQSDINSPYSRFGLGNIKTNRANTTLQGMGGIANAMTNGSLLNPSNPASVAFIDSLSILLDAGFYIKTVTYSTSSLSEKGSNGSFDYASAGFGITKWWKSGIGVLPYSNMDYNVLIDQYRNDVGSYNLSFVGEGGLNQAFWSNGFKITKNLAIGVNFNYIFGSLSDITTVYYPDSTFMLNGRRSIKTKVNDVKFDYGLIYTLPMKNDYVLNIGVNYTQKAKINCKRDVFIRSMFKGYGNNGESPVDTLVYLQDEKTSFTLPNGFGIGTVLKKGNQWMVGIDFNWNNWEGFTLNGANDSIQNSWNIAVGGSYKPTATSISGYLRRITYRMGFHYDQTYYNLYGHSINKYGMSVGFGLPLPRSLTSFNVALEIGKMGTIENNLVKESYFNISIGMSIHDRWFVKRKYK